MHIIFDMAYDQGVASSDVRAGQASIGKLFVGPNGLLNVLETHLGLTGKEAHHAVRIQGYMDCMAEVLAKPGASFFVHSYASDAWSSAKQMLAWRDELALAGWKGQSVDQFTPRLKALAVVEEVLPEHLKQGLGDRLQNVLIALEKIQSISIKQVELCDEGKGLPALLSKVFAVLGCRGVEISKSKPYKALAQGNLGAVQQAMLNPDGQSKDVVADDNSLILLQTPDEWSAANTVASWLKADEGNNANVLMIQGQGSDVLDSALQNAGLPMLGNNQRSAWRAALQVLPLALANTWKPLNIHSLLSFLSLPSSPVPSFAARRLRGAIQNEPGIGGDAWLKAENKIIEIRVGKNIEEGMQESEALKEAHAMMDDLNTHLSGLRFDSSEGIPPESLKAMCMWVKQGLKKPELENSMAQALAQVDRMIELADHYQKPIPRAQVERMLDSVIAEGGQNPNNITQASPWLRVADSGGITDAFDTIIWWNFIDPGQSALTFWSYEERLALQDLSIHLEASEQVRARETDQWRRAITLAGKRLILVTPNRLQGVSTQIHPLWDEIRYFAVNTSDSDSEKEAKHALLIVDGHKLNKQDTAFFAGRSINLASEQTYELPMPDIDTKVDADCIQKPEKLSFSQMNTMLGCPSKWAFSYHAGLRSMDSLSLPTGNTMIGSLCHKIVEDLYTPLRTWKAEAAKAKASELFDMRVPQMAAELLEPGRELEKERYRLDVCRAVETLIAAIDKAGLTVVATEGEVDGRDLDGIPFRGYIDLMLEDGDGNTFVIDLKWSGSTKYKKEEVKEGKALQLASYAWLLRKGKGAWAPGAYFMLAQGELLTDDSRFESKVTESLMSAKEVWDLGAKTWSSQFKQINEGLVEASGLIDEKALKADRKDADLMYSSPPCHFCDFGKLCGKTRAEA
ncbi:MAG: PD-(D/E)XK nuclease family protein [Mariprofundaceae bacterium]|nr:PD-(D/E)XK nuclease family protein [Mariprofundaceae bacterium]